MTALDAAGDSAPPRSACGSSPARGMAGSLDRRPRTRSQPHRDGRRARRRDRRRRPAGTVLLLPRLRRVAPRRVPARHRAHRPQSRPLRRPRPALGSSRELAVHRPRGDLSRRSGAQRRGLRSGRCNRCEPSTTRGCTFAATRCSASWRACSTGSTTPSAHIARAAETSGRLGFLQTEAYQLSSLGRAQCQAGDYDTGRATLQLPSTRPKPPATYEWRRSPESTSGRVLRAVGDWNEARAVLEETTAWHRAAGGGEQALLGECLLAAMDAADAIPGAHERLVRDPRRRPTE